MQQVHVFDGFHVIVGCFDYKPDTPCLTCVIGDALDCSDNHMIFPLHDHNIQVKVTAKYCIRRRYCVGGLYCYVRLTTKSSYGISTSNFELDEPCSALDSNCMLYEEGIEY